MTHRRLAVIIATLPIILGISVILALPRTHAQEPAETASEKLAAATEEQVSRAEGAGWYTCDVRGVGPGWGKVYLFLNCSGIPTNYFRARVDMKSDTLSAGLAALSEGRKVQVYLTGSAGHSEILACYVIM